LVYEEVLRVKKMSIINFEMEMCKPKAYYVAPTKKRHGNFKMGPK
jgi:hypothetical protein